MSENELGECRFEIVVGEKHKVGEGEDEEARYYGLAAWASERFGMTEVRYRWTTHDLWPVDRLAYIGRIGRGGKHLRRHRIRWLGHDQWDGGRDAPA